MKKYKSKPKFISAIQFDPFCMIKAYKFLGTLNKGGFLECGHGIDPTDGKFKVTTLNGAVVVDEWDFIIKSRDEFYPCKPDVFYANYDEVM